MKVRNTSIVNLHSLVLKYYKIAVDVLGIWWYTIRYKFIKMGAFAMEKIKNAEKIVEILHKNCKLSLEQVAAMLNMNITEVAEAIDELEKNGTILGYGAVVNWEKVSGRNKVTAYIELKVAPQRHNGFNRIAERIYQYPEVTSLNLMSGSYDFGVTVEGDNIKDISLFVSEHLAPMESVLSTATHFVLKRYKEDGVVLDVEEKDEREVISL